MALNLETEFQHLHRPANAIKTEDSCEACYGNKTSCYSETNYYWGNSDIPTEWK